jgi:pimeloyl-ACP methyl ester carboxylesterase
VRRGRTWLLVLLGLAALVLSPIAFAAWAGQRPPDWLPTPMVTFAFDVRLATAPLAKKMASISRGSLLDKRVYLAASGEQVRFASERVQLVGSLYGSGPEAARPGVLLLHGSTPEGRRMGLYRILAESLAQHGYAVLAIDQRGFGQSLPSPEPERPDAYDYVGDAVRALAFLARRPGVDSSRLNVVGHSFGVGIALTAGLMEPRTRSIVVLGPGAPRPPLEPRPVEPVEPIPPPPARVVVEAPRPDPARHYMARRAQRYGSMAWVAGVEYIGQPLSLEAHAAGELSGPGHKPLLVVTDAFEPTETHLALARWQQTLGGPNRLLIASRADHYLNTAGFGRVVIYDSRAVGEVLAEMDRWFGGSTAGCAARAACAWPGVPLVLVLAALVLIALLFVFLILRLRQRSSWGPV